MYFIHYTLHSNTFLFCKCSYVYSILFKLYNNNSGIELSELIYLNTSAAVYEKLDHLKETFRKLVN